MMTGIPVKKVATSESKKLVNMADDLRKMVIGQEEAISKIAKAIQRNRVGLKDPKKPIGSFIFLAPPALVKQNWPNHWPGTSSTAKMPWCGLTCRNTWKNSR